MAKSKQKVFLERVKWREGKKKEYTFLIQILIQIKPGEDSSVTVGENDNHINRIWYFTIELLSYLHEFLNSYSF